MLGATQGQRKANTRTLENLREPRVRSVRGGGRLLEKLKGALPVLHVLSRFLKVAHIPDDVHAQPGPREEDDHAVHLLHKGRARVFIDHKGDNDHVCLVALEAVHSRQPDLVGLCVVPCQEPSLRLVAQELLPHEHELALVGRQDDNGGLGDAACDQVVGQPDGHVGLLTVDLGEANLSLRLASRVSPEVYVRLDTWHLAALVCTALSSLALDHARGALFVILNGHDVGVVLARQVANVPPHPALDGENGRRNRVARRGADQSLEERDVHAIDALEGKLLHDGWLQLEVVPNHLQLDRARAEAGEEQRLQHLRCLFDNNGKRVGALDGLKPGNAAYDRAADH
mmetsp:Transcript_47438/g.135381  ORF Transcript_47438/g.135381 Transcript_47438/m.135381 type:complete len:342 (+) Transcript_47438:386-1411(+)